MPVTQVYPVDPQHPAPAAIAAAADALAAGQLVAFPTETVYGLGANALDPAAVERIFVAKQRPHTDPLIVHISGLDQLAQIAASAPPVMRRLAAAFWPGPLTVVLPRGPHVAPNVSSGRNTVAVRIPAHPVALALLERSRLPVAAPSANLFSRPSPTTAAHVLEDLAGRVDVVLDGGPTPIGLESTVVDLTVAPPRLLRPGGTAVEALLAVLPDLVVPARPAVAAPDAATPAPGLLLKHYSPRARVLLVRGSNTAVTAALRQLVAELAPQGVRIGILATAEDRRLFGELPVTWAVTGDAVDLEGMGQALFAQLRALDAQAVELILVREPPLAGLGLAIGDRLFRAAEGRVLDADADWNFHSIGDLFVGVIPKADH